ncbi:hypothetical protein [Bacillus sp. RSS_NA_20]|uniref:hypothetical protein n=1 Tax=Bacillus sp. RSS_NA_20 TaxID=2876777 RepID=UPI001CCD4B50|nr:hypothetical protein [Bacillus sp. RSS_NA_20]MCA0117404.1 hypothetical protein [Bacillus sp. RSS_NA_20]
MGHGYFLIAGKTEGFDYKEAKVLRCGGEFDVEAMINSLRGGGYTIFYVTKIAERIDDNLTKEAGANG